MKKKKGIALVMTIFLLAFFLAIGLNMFFLSLGTMKKEEHHDDNIVLDEEYDLAYHELALALKESTTEDVLIYFKEGGNGEYTSSPPSIGDGIFQKVVSSNGMGEFEVSVEIAGASIREMNVKEVGASEGTALKLGIEKID